MKITISITAKNGDTLVKKFQVDENVLEFTPAAATAKLAAYSQLHIFDMVKVFQEVEDEDL